MLKEEIDVTIQELRQRMIAAYPYFGLSSMTLWRLVRGLGFSYKTLKGQRYIFERSDLAQKRSLYLRKVEDARGRGDCVVYMDETWVFGGMVKRRGWEIRQYSWGKTAGKNKGKRGIVITALCDGGVIPGCTRVFVSGHQTAQDGSHRAMDHAVFEDWLRSSVPLMKDFAAGRNVTLVMDNAPYHTRVLEKVPSRRSAVSEIIEYLTSHGVEVAIDSTRDSLLEELDYFVASRGGAAALRCYAAEKICEDMGVNLLRLPPFHCYFNPVELCWSHLKHHLNKMGRPTDRLETVKGRAVEIMGAVTRRLCEGWCREAQREEDCARLKEALDANSYDVEDEDSSSSNTSSDSEILDDVRSEFSVEL
ncbi:hypothetical protein COOONC_15603 [Cooperia oncophora]